MPEEIADPWGGTPSPRARIAFAIGVAALTAMYVLYYGLDQPQRTSDFDQVWAAARALWHHQNPYDVIGDGKLFQWKWPFYYPLPAAVLALPVGVLPAIAARCIFSGVSAGALAWVITRDGWARVPAFASMSFVVSIQLSQWSPLFAAALLAPSLSWIGVVKPNWGIALVVAAASTRIWKPLIVGVGLLALVSFALQPGWIADWLSTVRSASHFRAPVTLPLGFLMLAAALRWKRPEARLLLAMACLPQTPGFYDALMLFTIPRTLRESLLLAIASYGVYFAMVYRSPWPADAAWMSDIAKFTLWFLYLPCVALVLRRPNEGSLPVSDQWLARFFRRAP